MSGPRSFIARWSRRKRAATASPLVGPVGEGSTPSAQQGCDPNASETAGCLGAPTSEISFDLTQLPSIESITAETDIRPFLAAGVPPELTRAALRRAWAADPRIREFIGLSENAWDFNAPDAIAGFGPLEMTDELRRQIMAMVGRNLAEAAPDKPNPSPIEALGAPAKPATADQSPKRISKTAHASVDSNMPERADPVAQRNVDDRARQHDAAEPDCAQPVVKRRHGRALPE
jgi:Protein of unknown function (DUF3306)